MRVAREPLLPIVLFKTEVKELRLRIPKVLGPDHAEVVHDAKNLVPYADLSKESVPIGLENFDRYIAVPTMPGDSFRWRAAGAGPQFPLHC